MSGGFKYIETNKVSKAQRRRDAKAAKNAEQLKRIEEGEKQNQFHDRRVEQEALQKIFDLSDLELHDIMADGDCLYRAVEHQLSIAKDARERLTAQELREKTQQYMLDYAEDFLPFLTNDDGSPMTEQAFKTYCDRIARTKEWGGHLELTAISNFTGKEIHIIQAGNVQPIIISPKSESKTQPILLSFHKHLYHLGKHYNSLVKKRG